MKSTLYVIGTICVGLAQHSLAKSPADSTPERPVPSINGSQLPVTKKTTAKPSAPAELRSVVASTEPIVIYRVQPLDNLSRIAAALGVSVAEIAKTNHLRDPDKIQRGQRLIIVPPKRVAVKSVTNKPSEKSLSARAKSKTVQASDSEEDQKIVLSAD
jgi:LysM repeat protein